MNLGSDPADQVVRYTLEGTEFALRISGTAAKNFAIFAAAVLRDQKKTRGKTNLTRLLREGKPLKFFSVSADRMREFAQEAKRHGLLFVPMRDRNDPDHIEIAIWADDSAKVERVIDRMQLDVVETGEAEIMTIRNPNKHRRALTVSPPKPPTDPSRLSRMMPTMTWVLLNRPRHLRSRATRRHPARPGEQTFRPRRPPPAEADRPIFLPSYAPNRQEMSVSACGTNCGRSKSCCVSGNLLHRSPKHRFASNAGIGHAEPEVFRLFSISG